MTIQEILKKGIERLKEQKIENPIATARILLGAVLGKPKEYLISHSNEQITEEVEQEFIKKISRITQGEPIQYITHQQEFMGLSFYVDETVLIPQPDTEILVEEILEIISKKEVSTVLDICTGSGVIAIAIANYTNAIEIQGSDISKEALQVARKNANMLKVSDKIIWLESNIFDKITKKNWDVIVSNPPYIESSCILTLDKQVQREPMVALDGGEDGLDFYRKIISLAKQYLAPKGYLCLEIGYNQKERVVSLFQDNGYQDIYSKKDLAGNDRIVVGQYSKE